LELQLAALRTALWNYDRTLPLMEGAVKVEGHTLAIEVDRPEAIFAKAFPNAEYAVTELSLSNSITAFSEGDCPYLLVPVFLRGRNVRFWPKADVPSCTAHVRSWG
jgi:4,5-dihydroxyphthalate decarboxylase